ncbi:phosphoribosylanthranilate isomerase [Carnobacterium iners]|uniref:N-(5'-phosphoribosyl)anthranilate isomerase n=1 Tax=Carnobacterium iners TaxID=1073423 RepID=A0A1X7MPP4_9LACT|nr:phosphoribosylanthranilate isomerase [Carnobacterium iners]SEK95092.1 phosphoribosylanthranilate isomerase [Carnobacterium iners]SMH26594.1 phosphoribosylanthranilate isomerase [Carnobacterium iners]
MKIKICGLSREKDIEYANLAMPDFIGFIINFPKSHRSITFEQAKNLKSKLNPKIKAVGVFVNLPYQAVAKICKENTIDIVQLHGKEDNGYIENLKRLTDKKIIKVFIVDKDFDPIKAENSLADYILFDSGMGSGKSFSIEQIRNIKRPFFLAGGLSSENIEEATAFIQPFSVDLSSGVETNKTKDLKKMIAAVKQTHRRKIG